MSRHDACQPTIERALYKAGWKIEARQVVLQIDLGRAYFDLRAIRRTEDGTKEILIVEVKCFSDERRRMSELYGAIGQYQMYRRWLRKAESVAPIYLAITSSAYHGIFDEDVMAVVEETQIKIVVVNLETEEVERWIEWT